MPEANSRFTERPRVIFNDDGATMLRGAPPPHTEEGIYAAVDYLRGTPVDVLCFLLGEQSGAYTYLSDRVASNMATSLQHFSKKKHTDAVESVGFAESENLALNLYRKGIDYLPILIDRAHQHGIRFFGSFRMNDCHLRSDPKGYLAPEFWRQHQDCRLWSLTKSKHYYNAALDYSYPEVRANYSAMIEEVLEKYDVDGIELDFGRNPYLFQAGEGWGKRHIMSDFVGATEQTIADAGRRRGKKISFLLRTVFNRDLLHDMGMDIENWLERGLLDLLVMTNWSSSTTNDNNTRLEPWQTLCEEHDVLFYPSLECMPAVNNRENGSAMILNPLTPPRQGNIHPATEGMVALTEKEKEKNCMLGTAQNYYGQGARGIYMFNVALNFAGLRDSAEERKANPVLQFWTSRLHQLGSQKELLKLEKRYLFWPECPVCVDSGRPPEHHQTIKFNIFDPTVRKSAAKACLSFRQVAEKHPHASETYVQDPIVPKGWVHYYLNGKRIEERCVHRSVRPEGRIPSQFVLSAHELITITVPANRFEFGENVMAFHIPRYPDARDPYVYIHGLTVDM